MSEKIYCPRCGKQFNQSTSFCRSCGLALDGVSEIVRGDELNAPTRSTKPNYSAIRFGIGLVMIGTIIGLIHTVLRDLDLFPVIYGKAVMIAFLVAGFICIGSAFLFPSTKYDKPKKNKGQIPLESNGEFKTGPLANQLGSTEIQGIDSAFSSDSREEVPVERSSVTEGTTRNLK